MCGIVGYVGEAGWLGENTLQRMRDTLEHRGPDGAGLHWQAGSITSPTSARGKERLGSYVVGLGHRRLSILDLSEAGSQPMCNEDGTVWVVYNGEFYNYSDFHGDLQARGHEFRSTGDTEMILHLYEEYGMEGLIERINGMYAFALWDGNKRHLFLARDQAGQKPLYYSLHSEGILFASEIKALKASGLFPAHAQHARGVGQFWVHGYSLGEHTCHQGIKRLRRGEVQCWELHPDAMKGMVLKREARTGRSCVNPPKYDMSRGKPHPIEALENILVDAVRLRLTSDVPVGLFLSGGIDSTLIAAIAVKHLGVRPQTFTMSFCDPDLDESRYAMEIARYLGLPNQVLRVNEAVSGSFRRIARHVDEPLGDPSLIPMWFLCREASQHVKVALSGDAGDELFGGYDEYLEARQVFRKEQRWKSPRNLAAHLLGPAMWHIVRGRRLRLKEWQRVKQVCNMRGVSYVGVLMDRAGKVRRDQKKHADAMAEIQQIDISSYLVDDVLVKVDRASMAHGVEVRSPLLDWRVRSFASQLPDVWRIGPAGESKYILRCLLEKMIPRELWDRPKQGFTPPWTEWCKTDELAHYLAQTQPGLLGLMNGKLVRHWQLFAYAACSDENTEARNGSFVRNAPECCA